MSTLVTIGILLGLVIMLWVNLYLMFQIRRCIWEILDEVETRASWVRGFNENIKEREEVEEWLDERRDEQAEA